MGLAEDVVPGREGEVTEVPIDKVPLDLKNVIGNRKVVIGPVDAFKTGVGTIPVTSIGGEGWFGDLLTGLLRIGGAIWPPLLAFEGIAGVLFKRKRKHYANALRALVPLDGKVEIGPALGSIVKALGVSHSSKKTEEVFENGDKEKERIVG